MRLFFVVLLLNISLYSKNVLILNSYSPVSKWTSEQSTSIINTLKVDKSIKIYVEFMNTKVFKPTTSSQKNLLNFFTHKYKKIHFDAVITTDDNALNFVINNQNNKLFEGSKFFFSGVNNLQLSSILPKDKFTGIFEEKDPIGNLNLAKKLKKNLDTVYLVGDNTITSRKIIEEYKSKYKNETKLNFVYLDYSNIEDVRNKLRSYNKNSVLMLMVFAAFKKEGEHINNLFALDAITKVYKEPMLTHDNIYTNLRNTNIIGGSCIDGAAAGRIAANDIIKYFNGISLEDISFKFTEGNNIYINERNLNKFGLDVEDLEIRLPIIVNKNNSFYKLYSTRINSFIIFFMILITSIYVYVRNNQYEALNKLNKEINYLNNTLEDKVSVQVEEIRKSTELFKTIFNTVKNGVAILDLNSNFILVNDEYEHITGLSKEQFYQTSCIEITSPKNKEEFKKIIEDIRGTGYLNGYLKQYIRKDGIVVDIQMDIFLMPDKQNILVVARDITRQNKHKREQKQKDEQLMEQSRLAQMGEMISMIAHQWRQPLGAIGSAIIGLKLQIRSKRVDFTKENEVDTYFKGLDTQYDSVNEYVQFLSATIDDFRNFFKPNKEKDNINLLIPIKKALQIVEVSLKNQNIELISNYLNSGDVLIYSNELTQVMLNILKNAEDNFIEKDIRDAKININTSKSSTYYKITISDNGGGISPNLLSKIFDPYYSTKQGKNGTGLGLYMSKIIIEEHNDGELSARNIQDGIEFTIKLPI